MINSADPAVYEVWWRGAWPLYDDLRTHTLTGRWKLPPQTLRDVARGILFLKTDQPYQWPRATGLKAFGRALLRLVSFGLVLPSMRKVEESMGDPEVWPFLRKQDYECALLRPPYLSRV